MQNSFVLKVKINLETCRQTPRQALGGDVKLVFKLNITLFWPEKKYKKGYATCHFRF